DTKISAPLDEQLMNVLCHRTFTLTIDLLDIQATKILQQPHTVRPDNPQDVIRSQEARHYCTSEINTYNTTVRNTGTVTIDNK
ncbi:phospho-sugar glycosidase domain-containing protein, partial [Acinetobacter johnsonii]